MCQSCRGALPFSALSCMGSYVCFIHTKMNYTIYRDPVLVFPRESFLIVCISHLKDGFWMVPYSETIYVIFILKASTLCRCCLCQGHSLPQAALLGGARERWVLGLSHGTRSQQLPAPLGSVCQSWKQLQAEPDGRVAGAASSSVCTATSALI